MLPPHTAVLTAIRRTFDFEGRSRRSEFWWFVLFSLLCFGIIQSVEGAFFSQPEYQMRDVGWGKIIDSFRLHPVTEVTDWVLTFMLVSLGIRRLHDLGKSGWTVVLGFIASILSSFIHPMRNSRVWNDANIPEISIQAYFNPSNYDVISPLFFLVAVVEVMLFSYCFIAAMVDGKSKANKYGESPKYSQDFDVFD